MGSLCLPEPPTKGSYHQHLSMSVFPLCPALIRVSFPLDKFMVHKPLPPPSSRPMRSSSHVSVTSPAPLGPWKASQLHGASGLKLSGVKAKGSLPCGMLVGICPPDFSVCVKLHVTWDQERRRGPNCHLLKVRLTSAVQVKDEPHEAPPPLPRDPSPHR